METKTLHPATSGGIIVCARIENPVSIFRTSKMYELRGDFFPRQILVLRNSSFSSRFFGVMETALVH